MSILKVNSIEAATPGSEDYFLTRAWATWQMDGVVSIHDSGRVSSITDNGVGDCSVNWSSALSNTNYCVSNSADYASGFIGLGLDYDAGSNDTRTTNALRQQFYLGAYYDTPRACVMVVA